MEQELIHGQNENEANREGEVGPTTDATNKVVYLEIEEHARSSNTSNTSTFNPAMVRKVEMLVPDQNSERLSNADRNVGKLPNSFPLLISSYHREHISHENKPVFVSRALLTIFAITRPSTTLLACDHTSVPSHETNNPCKAEPDRQDRNAASLTQEHPQSQRYSPVLPPGPQLPPETLVSSDEVARAVEIRPQSSSSSKQYSAIPQARPFIVNADEIRRESESLFQCTCNRSPRDLTQFDTDQTGCPQFTKPRKTITACSTINLERYQHNRIMLRPGVHVELSGERFMIVNQIIKTEDGDKVSLKGLMFHRVAKLDGKLEQGLNEVYQYSTIYKNDPREVSQQRHEVVSINDVKKRRNIRITNQPCPCLQSDPKDAIGLNVFDRQKWIVDNVFVVCRWEYMVTFADPSAQQRMTKGEVRLSRWNRNECAQKYSVDDDALRTAFRGDTTKGGASYEMCNSEEKHFEREASCRKAARDYSDSTTIIAPSNYAGTRNSPLEIDELASLIDKTVENIHYFEITGDDESLKGFIFPTFINDDGKIPEKQLFPAPTRPRSPRDNIRVEASLKISSPRGTVERYLQGSIVTKRHHSPAVVDVDRDESVILGTRPKKRIRLAETDEATNMEDLPIGALYQIGKHDRFGKESTRLSSDLPHSEADVRESIQNRSATPRKKFIKIKIVKKVQRYTLGDAFCGCGGVTRGAIMAGLRVDWAFDAMPDMCNSYMLNFPTAKVSCVEAWSFATTPKYGSKVDILHLSPPCQFYSYAHTVNGKDDETNTAASFAIDALLKKVKPRIATLENTGGLRDHDKYMNGIIKQFTSLGFSVRYANLDLRDYGVPANRIRFVLIAAW